MIRIADGDAGEFVVGQFVTAHTTLTWPQKIVVLKPGPEKISRNKGENRRSGLVL
jgi:hypothetical protein